MGVWFHLLLTCFSLSFHVVSSGACLCGFDVDRTLTASQGDLVHCPNSLVMPNVYDEAFCGGNLTLSTLTVNFKQTFCAQCYLAIISSGPCTGQAEQTALLSRLSTPLSESFVDASWSHEGCKGLPISPFLFDCKDGEKQLAIPGIVEWYYRALGVRISKSDIYFFDDKLSNVLNFMNSGYNAKQVACEQRDWAGAIGLCGAQPADVVPLEGVELCPTKYDPPDVVPCKVGDQVRCPCGEACMGDQCCRDGSTCPSARPEFQCAWPKYEDCTLQVIIS